MRTTLRTTPPARPRAANLASAALAVAALAAAALCPAALALTIELPADVDAAAAERGGTVITVDGLPDTEYDIQREGLSDVTLATVTTDASGRASHTAAPGQLVPWRPDGPVPVLAIGDGGPDDHAETSYRYRDAAEPAGAPAAAPGADPETGTRASLARLPERLDNHQRMNLHGISSAATYTDGDGRAVQAWGWWADDRRARIATREFPHGQWSPAIDVHDAVTGRELEYDSHNSIALGVAPNGKLFAAGNMHVDELQMAESTRPWDWTSLVSMPRSAMGNADTDRVTYPDFFTLAGRLHFVYREQENRGGKAYFRVLVKRYLHESGVWETAADLHRGANLRLYVPKVVVSPDGGRAHLLGAWRDDSRTGSGGGSGADNNRDVFHLYSDDGSTWRQYGAGALALPLWYDNGLGDRGTEVGETIWDTSNGDPVPQNVGQVVVGRDGEPHALLRARGSGDAFHARREGGRWVVTKLPWRSSSHTLVAHDGGVGAVFSSGDRVAYASLDPGHPTHRSPRTIARGLVNSRYTVRQDWTAQSRGHLSILLTETREERDGKVGSFDRDGNVLTVPLPLLESGDGAFADRDGLMPTGSL